MEELIDRVSVAARLDRKRAGEAVQLIAGFMLARLPPEKAAAIVERVPGLQVSGESTGGVASSMMPQALGLPVLFGKLTAMGLGFGEMQALGREMVSFLKERAGEGAVDDLTAAVPGLGQLIQTHG